MKSIKCSDLGESSCPFEAKGETSKEVKEKLFAHANEVHGEKLAKMSEGEMEHMNKKIDEMLA